MILLTGAWLISASCQTIETAGPKLPHPDRKLTREQLGRTPADVKMSFADILLQWEDIYQDYQKRK